MADKETFKQPTGNTETDTIIRAEDLTTGYRHKGSNTTIHCGLSFCLRRGRLTCLLGANGAGKSTLLRTIAGIQPPLSGKLLVNDKPINRLNNKKLSRTIGIVLTDKTHAGGLTVKELVALGRQPYTGFFGKLNASDNDMINKALSSVGMSHKAGTYIAELSDGERQKAMIAKVLVQECPLILLDEPTAFLDAASRIETMHLLHRLAADEHKAILISTHDVELALILADNLWLLTPNKLTCGVTEDLVLNGQMEHLFPDHPQINFSLPNGHYSPYFSVNRHIYVETSDDILMHWTTNALRRHGFLASNNPSNIHIEAKAKDCLKLSIGNKEQFTFNSFETLLDKLCQLHF